MKTADAILFLINKYSKGEQLKIAKILEWVESISPLPIRSKNFYSVDPLGSTLILAEWKAPPQLISEALLGYTTYRLGQIDDSVYSNFQPSIYSAQMFGLLEFVFSLNNEEEKRKDYQILLKKGYWPVELLVLLLAAHTDSIRKASKQMNQPDPLEKIILVHQANAIFIPLAERLGMWKIRRELKELAYLCEDIDAYEDDSERRDNLLNRISRYVEHIRGLVETAASKHGVRNLELRYEIGGVYKLRELRKRYKKNIPAPEDLVNFIPVLPSEEDCRRLVPVLLEVGIASRTLSDFIGAPRDNDYQAIHLVLRIPQLGGEKARFFIRTEEMQQRADIGILDKWHRGKPLSSTDELLFNRPPEGFIFVFSTDIDKRCVLPSDSSPVDLAYKIGEICGDRFCRARVYGQEDSEKDADYILQNGDIVKIILKTGPLPEQKWLDNVKTDVARQFIKSWDQRTVAKDELSSRTELQENKFNIGVAVIIPEEFVAAQFNLCERCRPYPPGQIVGYPTRKGDVTIHRIDCSVLYSAYATISLEWRSGILPQEQYRIVAHAWDRKGLLKDVAHKVTSRGVNMVKVSAEVKTNSTALITISMHGGSDELIEEIRQSIQDLPHIAQARLDHIEPTESAESLATTGQHKEIINRYSGYAVSDDGMFFGRASEIGSIRRILEGSEPTSSVYVVGLSRVGKTSLLKKIERLAQGNPYREFIPVFTSAQSISIRGQDLIGWFVKEVHFKLKNSPLTGIKLPQVDPFLLGAEPERAFQDYFRAILSALSPHYRLALMIDEFQQIENSPGELSVPFYGCLEYLVNEYQNVSFIFASSYNLNYETVSPELSWLKGRAKIVSLGALSRQAAQQLIRIPSYPLTYEEELVEQILHITQCYPFLINLLCQNMIDGFLQSHRIVDVPFAREITFEHYEKTLKTMLRRDRGQVFDHLLNAVDKGKEIIIEAVRLSPICDDWVAIENLVVNVCDRYAMLEKQVRSIIHILIDLDIFDQSVVNSTERVRVHIPIFYRWLQVNLPDQPTIVR